MAIAVLAFACTSGGAGGSVASLSPIVSPSVAPAPAATPATESPTPTVAESIEDRSPARSSDAPPSASLAVEGGDPVAGQLGSYTWNGGGSDSPWLPGAPIRVGTGERLTVSLATDPGVAEWTARRAAPGSLDGAGAVALGQGTAGIRFSAPPAGSWSVQLTIRFADDLGSATYYWKVTVP